MSGAGDPRLTPARPDLAAASLRGRVDAPRFAQGASRIVTAPVADLRRQPRADAALDTQALRGEPVTLFDEDEGWSWVQLQGDGYVGYIPSEALGPPATSTHRVVANRTFVYPAADMKRAVVAALPMGARVAVSGGDGAFSRLADGGFVFAAHLAPVAAAAADFVAVAEQLLHVPYLWGGRTPLGIDCSGLVQASLDACGLAVPRDADLQEQAIGQRLDEGAVETLRRGDLVFWRGHVGIMQDAQMMVHANAHHMRVASEPLRQAIDRILAASGAAITSLRRVIER